MRCLAARHPRARAARPPGHLVSLGARGGRGERGHLTRRTPRSLVPATLQGRRHGEKGGREAKEQGAPAGSSHHGLSMVART